MYTLEQASSDDHQMSLALGVGEFDVQERDQGQ